MWPSRLGFTEPTFPAVIHIQSRIQGAHGTTTDLPEIWLSMTRIGLVPSGRLGAGSTVVEAILSTTESEDRHA